jgi:hypothetical protein
MGVFDRAARGEWQRALATVISSSITNGSATVGDSKRAVWKVHLRIEPKGGRPVEVDGTANVPPGTSLWPGLRVAVRFDPRKPTMFQLDDSVDGALARIAERTQGKPVGGIDVADLVRQAVDDPGGLHKSIATMRENIEAEAALVHRSGESSQPLEIRLEHLGELHRTGVLNDHEFAAAKRRLLVEP